MTDSEGANGELDEDAYEDAAEEEDTEDLQVEALGPFTDNPDIDSPPANGSQVPDFATDPLPDPPPITSLLAGDVPFLLMAKSHLHAAQVPAALGVASRVTQGSIGLGAVIRLPRMSPSRAQSFLTSCASAQILIADPEVYALPGTGVPRGQLKSRYLSQYPWIAGVPAVSSSPQQRQQWANDVLNAQRTAGANVLLSASGWVSDQQAPVSLAAAMRWVSDSRAVAGSDPMFVNLTLASGWLSNPSLRSALLDEIVESNEPLWYLRVYWPIVEPRYGQLIDTAMLDGYKDLAQTARLEGKVLVLANSGLTGWIATALGGSGFSTGISWAEQAFAAERVFSNRPNQERPPAVPRYFDRTAFHPFTWQASESMDAAAVPGHLRCWCRFCRQMRAANEWDPGRAGAHYLVRAARLTSQLVTPNRRRAARQLVQDAQAFVASIAATPHALTGRYSPGHLAVWASLL